MAATLTTFSQALKEFYLPAIREQVNQQTFILSQIEKAPEEQIQGLEAVLFLHVTRNSGVAALADMGTLPNAGNQGYVQEKVPLKGLYGVIQVSDRTVRASRTNDGSVVRVIDAESKGIIADMRRNGNREIWGTSDGVMATAGVTTASTTVQLAAATPKSTMNQFEVGMVIDIATVSGGVYTPITNGNGAVISAIDKVNKTITIGAAVTTTSADFVGIHSSMGSGASQKEITGLQTQVAASGTLFSVNPTTYPVWTSTVTAVNGSISENLLDQLADDVNTASGEDIDLWIGSKGVRRAYKNLLTSLKRFTNTVALKGGYSGIEVYTGNQQSSALVSDRDTPDGTLWGLNTKHWREYADSEWGFIDEDNPGQILLRDSGPGGTASYSGTARKDWELATDMRNANGLLTGITEA